MKRLIVAGALFVSPAFAEDAKEPTVSLTQGELQIIVSEAIRNAQDAAAVQRAQGEAVMQKVRAALAQKPAASP